MIIEVFVVAGATLLLSALLTGGMRKLALAGGILDVPNERSLHHVSTPRGGGVAIVLSTTAAVAILAMFGVVQIQLVLVLAAGFAVAVVGFLDDRRQLTPGLRLIVHVGAALGGLAFLGGLPPIRIADHVLLFGWGGYLLGVLGIVWTLNLFNFMDGIDGIAASEAIFVVCCGAFLGLVGGHWSDVTGVGLILAAACAGFLLWNWPPAKIFMGDVGSGYLGYVIGMLAVAASRDNPAALWIWLILGGLFFVDATVTLVRRAIGRERLQEAHRTHAYQRLASRWGSHRKVTIATMILNICWLLPCALMAALHPRHAAWIAFGAMAPLVVLAVVLGAGQSARGHNQLAS